ncbi:hypothetical protein PPL_02427 [Heterostelium album PN500]|uniref:Phosphoribulokinase/uridine kinase domain-containing protein n=1 Tax=Heterostelium pallidum (strain ATCC 26659 / Pp 5 / PN500) TaxID=670386 RepID=D3AZP3_HETP5|nr:hypothetical protein PPL_02427 [Heterostelium album PN500]EFA85422.1 hypothetical protein PPL_02427 [Heterostelium album PN500]|eukprot:XP_020437531.1 hypothetical protein PPL_02427 [Heterostelium album PN500]
MNKEELLNKIDYLYNEINNRYNLRKEKNSSNKDVGNRMLVCIAGPPAAGKSTISVRLCEKLQSSGLKTVVVPMDGYHLDNCILKERSLLHRKGSPPTFDVIGFKTILDRLSKQQQQQPQQQSNNNNNNNNNSDDDDDDLEYNEIIIPTFDRELDISRAGAAVVDRSIEILLIEGNYLLLDVSPWNRLHRFFDFTIFIDADRSTLEQRLIQRWLDHQHDHESAVKRAKSNDIPNAIYTLDHSIKPDIKIINN